MYRHGTLGWKTNENMTVGMVLMAPVNECGPMIRDHCPNPKLNNQMGKYIVRYTLHMNPNMEVNLRWEQSRGIDKGIINNTE